jgi:hypothetical protein
MLESLKLPIPQGFRPREELLYDLRFLEDCQNLYINENGVFEAETFTRTAFGLNISAQVFVLRSGTYVLTLQSDATDDVLYSWNGSSLTALVSNIPSVTRSSLWSCADFGDYVLFTNGTTILVRDPSTGTFSIDNTTFPVSNWICAHRNGRVHLATPDTDTIDNGIVTCSFSTNKINIHTGITNNVVTSYTAAGSTVTDAIVVNGNIVSCDWTTNKIYVYNKFTGELSTSFDAPGNDINDLAFDGTNLLSMDYILKRVYIHDEVSGDILSFFSTPADNPVAMTVINGNLITTDSVTNRIYIHVNITASTSSDFDAPEYGTGNPLAPVGLANDGTNLISIEGTTNDKAFLHSGVTSNITSDLGAIADNPVGIGYYEWPQNSFAKWSKISELKFQSTATTDISNLSGYMPMEYPGELLRAEPLKQHVIYYGENGVSALTLAGTTYGMTTLHHAGVKDVGAVCLNGFADGTTAHYFIDTSGDLYIIDAGTS